jgi:hypothetical protein
MEKEWAVVFETDQLYRAEIALQVLQEEGVEAVIMNEKDSSYIVIGDIKVLVRNEFLVKAEELIKTLEF